MKQEGGPVRRVHRALRAFLLEHAALADAGRALVGVSGGPDSVCLLDAVAALQDETGVEARAAHLDHGLRGDESRADAAYVSGLCERLGVGLDAECADVAALAKQSRRSLEEAGRGARYDFFARVAHRRGAGAVLVAHTADDQAETVLLHLTRGAGLAGLGGMRPFASWRSPEGEVRVGRPLLGLTRADTEAYCAARELRPRLDSSNASLDFARNRIRREVMPVLQEINAGAGGNAARSAELAAQAVDYLESQAREWLAANGSTQSGAVALPRAALAAQHPALRAYVLREALRELVPDLRGIGSRHLDALDTLSAGASGRRADLPGGVAAYAEAADLVLRAWPPPVPAAPLEPRSLTLPGAGDAGPWRVEGSLVPSSEPFPDGRYAAHLDPDAARDLIVRTRRRGDRFQPLGMREAKSLQDFFVDAKVPRAERDGAPLLVANGEIIWVVGHRIGERAKVRHGARDALRVEFTLRNGADGGT